MMVNHRPYRNIAERFSLSLGALVRHHDDHLPEQLVKAREAEQVLQADALLREAVQIKDALKGIMARTLGAGELGQATAAGRAAFRCIETLLEVEGRLDRRPVLNLLVLPQWIEARSALLEALGPYPEARAAVAERLLGLEHGHASG